VKCVLPHEYEDLCKTLKVAWRNRQSGVQSAYNADKFMSEERFSGLQARRLMQCFFWSINDFECNP
jgi:hypothetical protein